MENKTITKMRMNKKGVELKSSLFAILAVSLYFVALGWIIPAWSEHYSSGVTYDLGEYNRMDNLTSITTSQQVRLTPDDPEPTTDIETSTYRGAFGVIMQSFKSFNMVFGSRGMVYTITDKLGIPSYIGQAIVIMMIISVTFTLIAIVFRQFFRSTV